MLAPIPAEPIVLSVENATTTDLFDGTAQNTPVHVIIRTTNELETFFRAIAFPGSFSPAENTDFQAARLFLASSCNAFAGIETVSAFILIEIEEHDRSNDNWGGYNGFKMIMIEHPDETETVRQKLWRILYQRRG